MRNVAVMSVGLIIHTVWLKSAILIQEEGPAACGAGEEDCDDVGQLQQPPQGGAGEH